MRALAILAAGLVIWLVTATQVPTHIRLPLASVILGAVVTQPFGCTNLVLEPLDPS